MRIGAAILVMITGCIVTVLIFPILTIWWLLGANKPFSKWYEYILDLTK